jgi:hypothetical protein
MNYTTLYLVRDYLGLAATETADDTRLTNLLAPSTRQIKQFMRRRSDIRRETLSFDHPAPLRSRLGKFSIEDFVLQMNALADYSSERLRLDQDLLEVLTLTNGDDTTISSDDYVLEHARLYPKYAIRLKAGSGVVWQYSSGGERLQVISVDGYWGYHDVYADAWVSSLDTLQTGINAVVTSMTVGDADGVAADLKAVRFQAGNLIRLTTAASAVEFMLVTAANYSTNVLTLVRGYAGTSAVAHIAEESIDVFRVAADIELACTRLVAWRYRQKDADAFNQESILGTTEVAIPTSMPEDVTRLLPLPKEEL